MSPNPRLHGLAVRLAALCLGLLFFGAATRASGETGYDLWLRYVPVKDAARQRAYRQAAAAIVVQGRSPTARAALGELPRGLRGLLGVERPVADAVPAGGGAVVVGTPSGSPLVAGPGWSERLAALGEEGYLIRSTRVGPHPATVIASLGDTGALYGTFHFLRLIQPTPTAPTSWPTR